MSRRQRNAALTILLLTAAAATAAETPVSGPRFDSLMSYQNIELQRVLETMYPESEGYLITGPLDPLLKVDDDLRPLFSSVRVICPDSASHRKSIDEFAAANVSDFSIRRAGGSRTSTVEPDWTGTLFNIDWRNGTVYVLFATTQQTRFLIWLRRVVLLGWESYDQETRRVYSRMVSRSLSETCSARSEDAEPRASDLGLPDVFDLYAPDPDYVIKGYENYKAFLREHRELKTDFASGIVAFVPTDETLRKLIEKAPQEAFPNKEAAKLQEEYRDFFKRGGDLRVLQTLTAEGFDTLRTGEYFFAVSLSGRIRFGRELLRGEVERLERETGRKVPRANHAFLFPGEYLLAAGAFFIDELKSPKLTEVSAQSGHYFYSNITVSIREDISLRSDHYFLTLGHFFYALDRLGIPDEDVLIRKF